MSTANELPERWAQRLVERGFVDRRGGDRYSIKALAETIGLHTTTVSEALRGSRRAHVETIEKISAALGSDVVAWFGLSSLGEWTPPSSAAMLTGRQRRAIEELINSMTERQAISHGTTTRRAGASPANIGEERSWRRRVSEPSPSVPEQAVAMDDPDLLSEREAQIEDP